MMMKNVMVAVLFVSCLFMSYSVAQAAPPAAVYATEPYSSGSFFATSKCLTQKFRCNDPGSRDEIISRADTCANETFGLGGLMGTLGSSKTEYKGCVIPNNYKDDPNTPLKKKWAVCCVAPAKTGDLCTFDCTMFYNNH